MEIMEDKDKLARFQRFLGFCVKRWGPEAMTIQNLIRVMPTKLYIELFGRIWDPESFTFQDWKLWPRQVELCDALDDDSVEVLWVPKSRQAGGSEIVATKITKLILSSRGSQAYSVSMNEVEAKYFLANRVAPKLMNMMPPVEFPYLFEGKEYVFRADWPKIKDPDAKTKLEIIGGGWFEALSSGPNAGHGRTGNIFLLDEASTIPDAESIYHSVLPALEHAKGKMIPLSNSDEACWFNEKTRDIIDGKFLGPKLFFLGADANPAHDEDWFKRARKNFATEKDFKIAHPRTLGDFLLTKSGKVYPTFDPQEGGDHVKFFEPNWDHDLYVIYDHGGSQHPAALSTCLYDKYDDMLYIVDEQLWTGVDVAQIITGPEGSRGIKKIYADFPKNPKMSIGDIQIFNKSGHDRTIADIFWDDAGILFEKAIKKDAEVSQQLVSMRFTNNKILIHPRCRNTIEQHFDWAYGKNGKPIDRRDDLCDTIKYVCRELYQVVRAEYKPPEPEHYTARARRAARAKYGRFASLSDNNLNSWQSA